MSSSSSFLGGMSLSASRATSKFWGRGDKRQVLAEAEEGFWQRQRRGFSRGRGGVLAEAEGQRTGDREAGGGQTDGGQRGIHEAAPTACFPPSASYLHDILDGGLEVERLDQCRLAEHLGIAHGTHLQGGTVVSSAACQRQRGSSLLRMIWPSRSRSSGSQQSAPPPPLPESLDKSKRQKPISSQHHHHHQ